MENIHRSLLQSYFGDRYWDKLTVGGDTVFLFLCFTNRSGSNFFAEVLASTGAINRADEFYNAGTVIDNSRNHGLSSPQAFINYIVRRLSKNKIFVSKIAVEQIIVLTEIGLLDQVLPRSHFILLERSDKLAQAISLVLAEMTGSWSAQQAVSAGNTEPDFDRQRIENAIQYLTNQHKSFELFFAENGLVPLQITYERFRSEPQQHLNYVLTMLSLNSLSINPNSLMLTPQTTKQNSDWRHRYLSDRPCL